MLSPRVNDINIELMLIMFSHNNTHSLSGNTHVWKHAALCINTEDGFRLARLNPSSGSRDSRLTVLRLIVGPQKVFEVLFSIGWNLINS